MKYTTYFCDSGYARISTVSTIQSQALSRHDSVQHLLIKTELYLQAHMCKIADLSAVFLSLIAGSFPHLIIYTILNCLENRYDMSRLSRRLLKDCTDIILCLHGTTRGDTYHSTMENMWSIKETMPRRRTIVFTVIDYKSIDFVRRIKDRN